VELEAHLVAPIRFSIQSSLTPKGARIFERAKCRSLKINKKSLCLAEMERRILSRLKVHVKREFDDEYFIVEKMIEDNALLPYIWVEQQWQRKNVLLDPQTEALRGDNNDVTYIATGDSLYAMVIFVLSVKKP
jgi:hypothetical protein